MFLSKLTPSLHLVSITRGFSHRLRSQKTICDFLYGQTLLIRVGIWRLLLLWHNVDSCRAEALMTSDTNMLAFINFISVFLSIQHYKFTGYVCTYLTGCINIYTLLWFLSSRLFLLLEKASPWVPPMVHWHLAKLCCIISKIINSFCSQFSLL
jgi:hypothetical protein